METQNVIMYRSKTAMMQDQWLWNNTDVVFPLGIYVLMFLLVAVILFNCTENRRYYGSRPKPNATPKPKVLEALLKFYERHKQACNVVAAALLAFPLMKLVLGLILL